MENNKKSGYVDIYLDKLVIVSGNVKFLITDKKNFLVNKFLIKHLPKNIEDMNLFDNKIKWTGIKDIKIIKNDIYISLTEEIKKNCYGTSVFQANFNLNYLNFKNLYRPKECVNKNKKISSFKFFNGYQTGGRIEWFDNKIYLSTGDYNNWEFPQNNRGFGKIVEINAKNHSYKLIASGLRNPQGMEAYHSEKNYLIITDHGPKGGDEINIINLNDPIKSNNFGWPTASYGEHYDVVPINKYTKKFAPLHKSHTKHGFKEPLYWFKESIRISAVIKIFFLVNLNL